MKRRHGAEMNISTEFEQELEQLLNRLFAEHGSNTPDFILARYLVACLIAWNVGVARREVWYGRDAQVSGGTGPAPVDPRAATEPR